MDNKKSKRYFLSTWAINPSDGKPYDVHITHDRMNFIARIGKSLIFEAAYIVPHILQNPRAIFEGLRSDNDEDKRGYGWRCYCGIPDYRYDNHGDALPPWPDKVFCVFVNSESIIYNWRWEKRALEESGLPINYENRFHERLL